MSSLDRRTRNKENTRRLILEAAMKLFVENGIEKTTIREIADKIEYSVGSVYMHFKDKTAIFYALHKQGFQEMKARFQVLNAVKDPFERLKALGQAYLDFASEKPDLYELMFVLPEPMEHLSNTNEEDWAEGMGTFSVLSDTVKECLAKGHFAGHSEEPLSFLIWSAVHGMASLNISKRTYRVNITNPESILNDSFNEFLKMIEK